ncbi:tetratricopeptide repeat-containing response regulator [Pseudogulbenkiania sp. MAI-1]|uniref:tetratricopeptide repeat-containing response regulator n=1 Tax=Pseudogulbenkiania sp. MAI-1 TaxID=990370 RepID=UPI00045E969E|nr:tetratricopeptide repeat-containing response regulator [Pseudogulbenkiania sp. MAI-1]
MSVDQSDKIDFAKKRFLIVDDFEGMCNILRDLLRKCGARQIDTVTKGREAITALTRNSYDVVLCDYYLGSGKNGQQVLEEARHQKLIGPATIWIMITAEKNSDMVMGAIEHHPDDYLIKPLTEAILQTRLAKLAQKKTQLAAIEAAIRSKEYLKAIALCDQRLAEDKGSDAHLARLRCDLLMLTGNFEEARASYDRQLAVRDAPWAKVGLAKLYFQKARYQQARELLEQVIETNRALLEAYDWLARTLVCMEEWSSAEALLQRATALSPNSIGRQQSLGDVALRCNSLDVAEQAYSKALTLGANSNMKKAGPYLGLARVYTEKGAPKEALAVLGRLAHEVEGNSIKLQAKAAEVRVFHKTGDTEQARLCAEALSTQIQSGVHGMPPSVTLELAESLMEIGNKEVGSQLIQFVVRNHHEDETLISRAQDIYTKADMGEEGADLVASARRTAVETMDKGVRLGAQGKLDEAIEAMRAAYTLMPHNSRLLLNLAYLLIQYQEKNGWHHGMSSEARKAIETARRYTPDNQRCGELLAKLEKLG